MCPLTLVASPLSMSFSRMDIPAFGRSPAVNTSGEGLGSKRLFDNPSQTRNATTRDLYLAMSDALPPVSTSVDLKARVGAEKYQRMGLTCESSSF